MKARTVLVLLAGVLLYTCPCWANAVYTATLTAEKDNCYVGGIRDDFEHHGIRLTVNVPQPDGTPLSNRILVNIKIINGPPDGMGPSIEYIPSVACACDASVPFPCPCLPPEGGTIHAIFWSGKGEGTCDVIAEVIPCSFDDVYAQSEPVSIIMLAPYLVPQDVTPELPEGDEGAEPPTKDLELPFGTPHDPPEPLCHDYIPVKISFNAKVEAYTGEGILGHSLEYSVMAFYRSRFEGRTPTDEEMDNNTPDFSYVWPGIYSDPVPLWWLSPNPDQTNDLGSSWVHGAFWGRQSVWIRVTVTDKDVFRAVWRPVLTKRQSLWKMLPLLAKSPTRPTTVRLKPRVSRQSLSSPASLLTDYELVYIPQAWNYPKFLSWKQGMIERDHSFLHPIVHPVLSWWDEGVKKSTVFPNHERRLIPKLHQLPAAFGPCKVQFKLEGERHWYDDCRPPCERGLLSPCGPTVPYWQAVVPEDSWYSNPMNDFCQASRGTCSPGGVQLVGIWKTDNPSTKGKANPDEGWAVVSVGSIWEMYALSTRSNWHDEAEKTAIEEIGHALFGLGGHDKDDPHYLVDGKFCVMQHGELAEGPELSNQFCDECRELIMDYSFY